MIALAQDLRMLIVQYIIFIIAGLMLCLKEHLMQIMRNGLGDPRVARLLEKVIVPMLK